MDLFRARRRHSKAGRPNHNLFAAYRRCAIEKMEQRQLLAADIIVGAAYYEDASGQDELGDSIELTFQGGEAGTQLAQITIETDKLGDGLTIGDVFFDTAPSGIGAFEAVGLSIIDQTGIDSVNVSVVDGGTTLTLTFTGFDPGEKLVFSVDVDEQGFLGPNAVAEGNEFEGSSLSATFTAPHYFAAVGSDIFFDAYDAKLTGSGLDLPPDDYIPPGVLPNPVRTAGAIFNLTQEPLPITISGTVYEDFNLNNSQDLGDDGISGVSLTLLKFDGSNYVSTGETALTNALGDYSFDGVAPGQYRVQETQPAGYFSVGATAGTVGGVTTGSVTSEDVISGISLSGGDDSIGNDFAEALPGELHGNVYHDADNDGIFDPGEVGIGGVTIEVQLLPGGGATGPAPIAVQTMADGSWWAVGLRPGAYEIREIQPSGFFDGIDTAGTAGGVAQNPGDQIVGVSLISGQIGDEYNFGELVPASLSGHVFADDDNDGNFDAAEAGIAGVTLTLLDGAGVSTGSTTTTDAIGFYSFDNLLPGVYGVAEVQPVGFFDGIDTAGTAGGVALNPGDRITGAVISSGVNGQNYDFGEIRPASLSGHVYADDNNNGFFDFGETGIAGVSLALVDAGNHPTGMTTVTDANGFYSFTTLTPGIYGVVETQPTGFLDGTDSAGNAGGVAENPGDRITGAVLSAGTNAQRYDFGELRPASIGGNVFADDNNDGFFGPVESGIGGVTLELFAGGNATGITTTTSADGSYRFGNLLPGVYGVAETQPMGYLDGTDTAGSAGGVAKNPGDLITGAILTPGTDGQNYNFGEVRPGAISGFVFQDGETVETDDPGSIEPEKIRDGLHTPDDTPIGGVTLRLADAIGQPILDLSGQPVTTVTDQNGFYEFTNLSPGVYTVYQAHPPTYIDGVDTAGSTGGVAFNPGAVIGPTILANDPKNDAISQIAISAGTHSSDNNFSELLAVPPLPPPPSSPPETPPFPFFLQTPGPALPPVRTPFAVPAPSRVPVATPVNATPPPPIFFGGSAYLVAPYTWHLSIIDAGDPRGPEGANDLVVHNTSARFNVSAWSGTNLKGGQWTLSGTNAAARSDDAPPLEVSPFIFGLNDAIGVTGDFDGDGVTEVGVFLDGEWFLDLNGNGIWDSEDLWAKLGETGDLPVTGDWDGDGKTDIGIFGPEWLGDPRAVAAEPGLPGAENRVTGPHKNLPPLPHHATVGRRTMKQTADGRIRADLIDHVFQYGQSGDRPISGDWNGDGIDSVGVFRNGRWLLDVDGDGRLTAADLGFDLGADGDWPVVGDFNGDGFDQVGVYRNGTWTIDSNGDRILDAHDRVFEMGGPGDQPVVGDWDGDGRDEIGLYSEHNNASSEF